MNPYTFIPLSSFLINTILSAVVLALNPQSKTNRAYSLFTCSFAGWAFLNYLEWNFSSPAFLSVCAHIEPIFWLPSTLLVLNFIYVLTKKSKDWIFWTFTAIVAMWSVIAVSTGCMLVRFQHTYWGEIAIVTKYYLPSVIMSSFIPALYGFYILLKSVRTASDKHFRTQLIYLTIGTITMYVLVFAESVFRTSLLHMQSIPFFGTFFLIIQSLFVFFAIARHRFLSLDVRDAAHAIFSQVHEAVILLDLNQGIIDMNEAACEFLGILKTAKIEPLERLFGHDYRFNENCKNREFTFSKNGLAQIGLLSQSDLFDRERLIGKLIIIHDITRQREDEQKRASLENKIQQSHVSRLEALGMLAGGIAHDFNNMLAGVIGYADLLRMRIDGKDKKLATYSENIIKAVQQAANLTKKLLTFARRNVSEMTCFNLHDTIMDTALLLEHTLNKRIVIKTSLTAHRFALSGDRAQIQNLLLNMAINAGDAMPDGGELRIETFNKELSLAEAQTSNTECEGGNYVVMKVEDNGTGMTEEVKKQIFNPFFTTKQLGKGTGLGLASAYGIARTHKGFISVDTQLGKGTTFLVYFPTTSQEFISEPDTIQTIEQGQGTILLVDDEEGIRESAAEMLTTIGYTVTTFSCGIDAIKWLRDQGGKTDLALLDVMMPKMTGDQCAAELQKINPLLKIMFISGYPGTLSEEKLATLSKARGPVEIVQKPFTIEQLSRIVKTAIAG